MSDNVLSFPVPDAAKLEEALSSRKRLTDVMRITIESLAHQMQALSVGLACLSQEEFDAIFGAVWLANYRACTLLQVAHEQNGFPLSDDDMAVMARLERLNAPMNRPTPTHIT